MRPDPPDRGGSDNAILAAQAQLAGANRSLAVSLTGTCVALLTFLLFFLYDRYIADEINALLFQATAAIVVALFLFGYSAVYCYRVMGAMIRSSSKVKGYLFRADLLFFFGSLVITLEPALILYTVRLNEVATIALVLWAGFIALAVMSRRDLAEPRRTRGPRRERRKGRGRCRTNLLRTREA